MVKHFVLLQRFRGVKSLLERFSDVNSAIKQFDQSICQIDVIIDVRMTPRKSFVIRTKFIALVVWPMVDSTII